MLDVCGVDGSVRAGHLRSGLLEEGILGRIRYLRFQFIEKLCSSSQDGALSDQLH